MTNFGAKILNNATSSLAAQQSVIATIGNNIANVNTAGYARRVVDLQTRVNNAAPGTLNIGNGVTIGDIQRVADSFIDNILRDATSTEGQTGVELEFMKRMEGLFAVTDGTPTIGSALTAFFNSLNDLSLDASSIELRKNVMERAEDLVTTIQTSFNALADLQDEADTRISSELDNVNSLTSQIAQLNGLISSREATGTTAADERDRRDILMTQLAGKISYSTVENNDGSVTLSLSNGFTLVNGTNSRELSLTTTPSFGTTPMPPSLSGGILNHIVYDYSGGSGTSEIELTEVIKNGSGSIAGLLEIRGYNEVGNSSAFQADGLLPEMASRIEAITRQLLVQFNQTYLGADENTASTTSHQASTADLDGVASTGPFAFFTFPSAVEVAVGTVANPTGYPTISDLTQNGAGAIFSSQLALAFSDPRRFSAARDSDATSGVTSFEPGNGDNARALANLQNSSLSFSSGSFSLTGATFSGAYAEAVTHVGNAKARADLDNSVAESNLVTVKSRRDEVSGVSLDEEFTSLIRFQKAYQASARMISVADELLTQIIQLI